MSKYIWPLPGEGAVAHEILAAEARAAIPGLVTYSLDARRDAILAELVAAVFGGTTLPGTLFATGGFTGTNLNAGWFQQQEAPFTLAAGNNNDVDPQFVTTYLLTANAGGSTITGISGNQSGRQFRLIKVAGGTLTVANQSTASQVANRIITGTGADVTVATDGVVTLEYDAVTQRWRIVAAH